MINVSSDRKLRLHPASQRVEQSPIFKKIISDKKILTIGEYIVSFQIV